MVEEKKVEDNKVYEWRSIPRDKIDWHPTIDEKKCIGCGICYTGCGKKVYDFDFKRNKPIVARPNNCMVGCTTCQVTCLANAISFPDKAYVKELIVKNDIISKTKKKLEELKGVQK